MSAREAEKPRWAVRRSHLSGFVCPAEGTGGLIWPPTESGPFVCPARTQGWAWLWGAAVLTPRCLLVLRCSLCVPDRPAQHRSQGRAHPGGRPHHPGRSASGRWPRLVPLPKQQAGSNKLEGYERVSARRGATGSSALGSDVCQRPERAGGPPRQPFPAPRHPGTGQRRLRSRPPRDRHVTWGPEHCCVRCLGRVSAGPSASGLVLSLKRERFWKM